MAAQRAEYVALRDLQVNGVRGYSEGDPVPAGPVENCGFVIGEDVAPSGLALMPKPARNASRNAWAAYAVDQGAEAGRRRLDDPRPAGRPSSRSRHRSPTRPTRADGPRVRA